MISMALLGLLLFLQTISILDISRFLEIAILLPRLQNLILLLQTSLEPSVRVRKEFINQNKTRVLSPLPTTYICFTISILYYVIYSCLPFTTTSPPHVFLCLLCHYSVIRTKKNRYTAQLPCAFGLYNSSTIDGLIDKEILTTILNEDYLLRSPRHKTK